MSLLLTYLLYWRPKITTQKQWVNCCNH